VGSAVKLGHYDGDQLVEVEGRASKWSTPLHVQDHPADRDRPAAVATGTRRPLTARAPSGKRLAVR